MSLRIHPLILHEIFPSGPGWTLLAITLLLLATAAVLFPLVFIRRRGGGMVLVWAWLVESVLFAVAVPNHDPANLVRAVLTLILPAAIIHVRAKRRPEGRKLVDIAFAAPALWFGTILSTFSTL